MRLVGTVENNRDVMVTLVVIQLLDAGKHLAFEQSGTDDEDGHIGVAVDNLRVGHNLDGRTIEQDIVILGAQLVEERFQAGGIEKLGGVGGNGTHGKDVHEMILVGTIPE